MISDNKEKYMIKAAVESVCFLLKEQFRNYLKV